MVGELKKSSLELIHGICETCECLNVYFQISSI